MTLSPRGRGLGQRIVTGAGWTITLQLVMRSLGVVSMIILARLLAPADFGLVALATAIGSGIALLSSFNFQVWLIRQPTAERTHYDTVWTLSIVCGLVTCGLLFLLAHPAARLFDEPRLARIVQFIGIAAVVRAFWNVGIVDFQKHLDFDKEFRLVLTSRLGAFFVTIGLAWVLRDYRALVGGIIARPVITLLLSYTTHNYRPRLSLSHWRDAFGFSKWLLAGEYLSFLYSRTDHFILGKVASTAGLGTYSVAHEIASLASTELVMPIRRVLIPGYAKLIGDRSALRDGFADGFAVILLVCAPVAAGLGLVADPLVRVALGDKWLEAIPLLQILTLYGISSVASANFGPVLITLGHTRTLANVQVIGLVVLVPLFVWGFDRFGLIGAAWAVGLADLAALVVALAITLRLLELRVTALLARVWRVVVAIVVMAIAVLGLGSLLGAAGTATWAVLLASVVTGAVAYTAAVAGLWLASARPRGPEALVVDHVRERLAARAVRP